MTRAVWGKLKLKFLKYVFIIEMIWINTDLTDRVNWEPPS